MIFYFTGTGNSLWAAKQLAKDGEQLVNIADARKKSEYSYSIVEDENVGFVFPVYCYTLGNAVLDFVSNIELKNAEYVYAVITCGGSIGGTGGYLKKELAKRGITLNHVFELLMPDNGVFYYSVTNESEAGKLLGNAENKLKEIASSVNDRSIKKIGGGAVSQAMRGIYCVMNGTKCFYVKDSCIGCGMCARLCPDSAIEIQSGKPVWVKSHCTKCSSCINRCPKQAIQYGKATEKRERYVNPVFKGGVR